MAICMYTSPPPRGGAPRLLTCSERPSERPKWRSMGRVTVRSTSTPTSPVAFVTPRSVMASGSLPNGASARSG
eukprot:scaffold4883_cov62-Phaeocystis_antarctica.AAC.6